MKGLSEKNAYYTKMYNGSSSSFYISA